MIDGNAFEISQASQMEPLNEIDHLGSYNDLIASAWLQPS
jgi:hypothetical protein